MPTKTKENLLTAMQLALYGQVETESMSGAHGKIISIDFIRNEAHVEYTGGVVANHPLSALKPILRPLSDMTDEEVLRVCELASHVPFLTKKKWKIDRGLNDVICISSKRSEYFFSVYIHNNTGYGDVTVSRHYEDVEPETEQTSNISLITQFYLERGLDCFGWIDDGRAIDKTKI